MRFLNNFLRLPFIKLLTVPASIAAAIGFLGLIVVIVETYFFGAGEAARVLPFGPQTARTILSTLAAAAMTALSLAYSLTLVVFTLAAGNIGPRLLKRFTSDMVNQVTAGILGGAFLYAVAVMYATYEGQVSLFGMIGAALLTILIVFQLIFFVREVSRSVTIDDEIAEISKRLKQAFKGQYEKEHQEEPPEDCEHELIAPVSGYLGEIDRKVVCEALKGADAQLVISVSPGTFVLKDTAFGRLSVDIGDEALETIKEAIRFEPSRSENSPVEFSVNLLTEIALRALSPGVNDTFTAIAAIDALSDAFSMIQSSAADTHVTAKDEDGQARLFMLRSRLSELMDMAFHPIRRAARDNVLMAQALARTIARLNDSGDDQLREKLKEHARLLEADLDSVEMLDEDKKSVTDLWPATLKQ